MALEIQFFCPRWGSEHMSWDGFCRKVKQEGYDGIEYAIAHNVTGKDLDLAWNAAAKHNLRIIAQHFDTYTADFPRHYNAYCTWLQRIRSYQPLKVNSQTGKDFFTFQQNKELIDAAADSGMQVIHETHRNKFSFAAHVAKNYMENIPELRITLDVSHWVCVAESFLDDQASAMQLAIERTDHIHARVGYPEGPQVADPRVEEWQEALNKHLKWWDQVVKYKKKQSPDGPLTISPEFGPFPYMVRIPASGKPIAGQWEINSYMMHLLKKRYTHTNESTCKKRMAAHTL